MNPGYSPTGTMPAKTSTGNFGQPWKEKIPSGHRKTMVQQFTPEQMQLFSQGMQNVGPESYLSRLAAGDQSQFEQMEAPAMRQFAEMQGGLASRFSGMGGTGARRSSGFQAAGNQAASDFAMQLQANRQQLQRQAQQDLHNMSQQLLNQRPYDVQLQKKPQGFDWGGALGALGGGVAGFFAGGPMGAISGARMGNQAFGRTPLAGGEGANFQSSQGWIPSWSGKGYDQTPSLAQGYDQMFRMNPGLMGY